MCCIKLCTEAILVNFFGSPYFKELGDDEVDVWRIQSCAAFLANNLPGYVAYDTDIASFQEVGSKGVFKMDEESLKIRSNGTIEREKYNWSFPASVGQEIEKIVDCFFEKKLYKRKIQPVSMLVG